MLNPQAGIQVDKFYQPQDWQYSFPDGYIRLEYIQSDGNAYIDTNFNANQDTVVKCRTSNSLTGTQIFIGSMTSGNIYAIGQQSSSNLLFAQYYTTNSNDRITSVAGNGGIIRDFELRKNEFYINNTLIGTFTSRTFTTNTLKLFAINPESSISKVKMYSCIIFDDLTLVRNFVPVKRNSDGVLGMYDLVNNVFYTNQGSGTFIAGPELYQNHSSIDIRQKNNINFSQRYKFNANNELTWANPNLYLTGKVNYTKVGNPTITDNVVSGFSASNYLQLNQAFNPSNNKWEVKIKINIGNSFPTSGVATYFFRSAISAPSQAGRFGIILSVRDTKHFRFSISADGTSFLSIPDGTYTILANTDYWVKFGWNGTEYYLDYSTDNITFTRDITAINSNSVYNGLTISQFGITSYNGSYRDYWLGTIDLKETYIKVNDEMWFYGKNYTSQNYAPVPAGLNCKIKGPVSYTEFGTLTNNDGVYSGFSANDYLSLSQPFTLSSTTKAEFIIKVNNTTFDGSSSFLGDNRSNTLNLRFNSAKKLAFYLGDGNNWIINALTGTTTFQIDIFYYVKLTIDNGTITIYSSIDGVSWTQETTTTITITPYIYNLLLGRARSDSSGQKGSIDMNETYITVNGQPWFGNFETTPSIGYVNTQTQVFTPAPEGVKYKEQRDLTVIPPEDNTITLLYGTQESHHLPSEYTELEYIQSSGTQYIDTGVKPTNNTTIKAKVMPMQQDNFVYGSRTSSSASNLHCWIFATSFNNIWEYPQFGNDSGGGYTKYNLNEIYDIENGQNGAYLNNVKIKTFSTYSFNSTLNMYLFGLNQNGSLENRTFVGRIYTFQIIEDTNLIRNFVPVLRKSDNEIGMLDTVEGKFYGNAGTGTFTAGAFKYGLFGLLANTSSGNYDVYIDDVLYATTTKNTQTDIDFSALGSEYVPIGTCTTPEELVLHKIVIKPRTSGSTLIKFQCKRTTSSGTQNQGIMWCNLQLENSISLVNGFGSESSYNNKILYAVTAKNNKIIIASTNSNTSGLYSIYARCSSLIYSPILEYDTTSYVNGVYLSFDQTQLKRVIIKNNPSIDMAIIRNAQQLEKIDIENPISLRSGTASGTSVQNAFKLELLPKYETETRTCDTINMYYTTSLYPTKINESTNKLRKLLRIYGSSTYPMYGLRGLKVSNEAPFDYSAPQINVSYTGLDRDALVELFNSIPYNVGYTEVGTPTITDGVVSGFDSSNYLQLNNANILSQVNEWEILIKIGTNTGAYILGSNKNNLITISIGTSRFFLSSDGTNWDIANGVGLNSRMPENSYVRLRFTGTQYILDYSLDKQTWTACGSVNSQTKISNLLEYIKLGSWTTSSNFTGSIDLNETYIKIKENNEWIPWFTGKAARAENPQINYTAATGNNLTKVGNVVIDENGIASGFTTSNYINLSTKIQSVSGWKTLKIHTEFKVSSLTAAAVVFGIGAYNIKLSVRSGNYFYFQYRSLSNPSALQTASSNNSVIPLNSNIIVDLDCVKDTSAHLIIKSGTSTLWDFSTNNFTINSNDNFLFGTDITYFGGNNLFIDLENTYIKVDQNYLMKGYLTDNDKAILTRKNWTLA